MNGGIPADVSELVARILAAGVHRRSGFKWRTFLGYLRATLSNLQRRSRSPENVRRHYDLGNDLYRNMLGRRLVYSCDNWEHARDLDAAEESKLDFVCRKLRLEPRMKVLDIGCGWGSFAAYAAEKYGAQVVGVTLSKEQAELGRHLCADLPVEIRVQDYRDVQAKFDRIVSLGMLEHVGYKNYRKYMLTVHRCMEKNGIFYLSSIGSNDSMHCTNPWTDKYIFPNSVVPSMKQIGAAIEGLFTMEELRNWPDFYDQTLMAWWDKFRKNWSSLEPKYGRRFYRMWKFFLLSSAGCFRSRYLQAWQILLARAA